MLNQIMVADLREFGLTEYEARAYLTLAIHGSSIASFVAEKTKIPSSKIYDVMYALRVKGLVEVAKSKPRKFKAIDPKYGLGGIVEKREVIMNQLKVKTNSILEKLKPLKTIGDSEVWSSVGKKAFYEKISDLLKKSNSYGIATTVNFSRFSHVDENFIDAINRGVKVRILCTSELDLTSASRAQWYLNNGAEIRIKPMDIQPVFGLVDDNEVVFRSSSVEYNFVCSNDMSLVNVIKNYFENIWEQAKPIQQCLSVLQEH